MRWCSGKDCAFRRVEVGVFVSEEAGVGVRESVGLEEVNEFHCWHGGGCVAQIGGNAAVQRAISAKETAWSMGDRPSRRY